MAIYYNQTVIVTDVGIYEDAGRLAIASCIFVNTQKLRQLRVEN